MGICRWMGSQILGILGVRNTGKQGFKKWKIRGQKKGLMSWDHKNYICLTVTKGGLYLATEYYNEVGVDPGTPLLPPPSPLPRCHAQYKLNVEDDNYPWFCLLTALTSSAKHVFMDDFLTPRHLRKPNRYFNEWHTLVTNKDLPKSQEHNRNAILRSLKQPRDRTVWNRSTLFSSRSYRLTKMLVFSSTRVR